MNIKKKSLLKTKIKMEINKTYNNSNIKKKKNYKARKFNNRNKSKLNLLKSNKIKSIYD